MWLAFAFIVLAGSATLLLVLPVDLRFRGSGDAFAGDLTALLRVEWLGGRVGRDIRLQTGQQHSGPRAWPTREQLALLWEEEFRSRVIQLLRSCRVWVSVEELRGRARVGLGDPADTGMAMGLILPAVEAARGLPAVELEITPDFAEACLAGEVDGAVRAVPIGLLVHLAAFALQPATLRTFRRLRSLRS